MIITVASGKGGVGKSLISAYLHSLLGGKALDCDADNPSLHVWLGIEKWEREIPLYLSEKAFARESLKTRCPFNAIRKGKIIRALCNGCGLCKLLEPEKVEMRRVLTGWIRIKGNILSAKLKPGETGSGKIVDEMKRIAGKSGIEIRDAPAGIGCATISAIQGSDLVLIVVEPSKASIQAMERVREVTSHFGIPQMVVINKADLNRRIVEMLMKRERIAGVIPYRRDVFEALQERRLPESVEGEMSEIAEVVKEWWEERGKG